MKTMTYKGYTTEIIYSDEDECFVGHIVNIDAISGFHGDTDEELRDAFENMVELYIETLEEPENPPQTHFAGRLLSRLRQALHL
ncbi:toxin-antitoxin system HicB family antitoxin [Candidatus Poribacteria bacterium]|nr:toxin-antitoxin system HicB family antitoxin [Candidatus Poribacteria bacterium]